MSNTNMDYEPTVQDVAILREWIKKMPHIVQDYDDQFLAAFIKGKKGSLQKAKLVLENFNSNGMRFPEFAGHLDILNPMTQKCLKELFVCPLPKRLDDGSHVFLVATNPKDTESKKLHVVETWRYWIMLFMVFTWENDLYTKDVTILDWKNLRLSHVKEVTPVFLTRLAESILQCTPIRIIKVHNINVPPALEWLLNVIKSVVKKKLADRVHFISSIDTLYESIPREILPEEYGGNEDNLKTIHDRWLKKVETYRDRLIEESNKMRELDPLRPKKEDTDDMTGTFKTLNVD